MTLCAATLIVASATIAIAQEGFDASKGVAIPSSALTFENINPAIRMAHAYGNRGVGAHGSFGQFPANFITPLHTHTGAYHNVVIKGQMTNPLKGVKTRQCSSPARTGMPPQAWSTPRPASPSPRANSTFTPKGHLVFMW